jgi:outer membrane protein OmpA-like peptidoglycan-associated protein
MIYIKALSSLCLIFLIINAVSYSVADSNANKYGVYGGINLNLHQANLRNLPGIPNCCPRYEKGTGLGFNLGILYERSISNRIRIGARLGVQTFNGTLTAEDTTTLNAPDCTVSGIFEHRVESSFLNFGFEPMLMYNVFKNFHFSLGARFGQNLTKNFSQVETIVKPDGVGTFLDDDGNDTGLRTRNDTSGYLPDAIGFQYGLVTGLSYELPLNPKNTLRLVPELFYYHTFTELVENTDWSLSSIRASIAIKYAPIVEINKGKIFSQESKIDTIRVETEIIAGDNFRKGAEFVNTFTDEVGDEIITTDVVTRIDTMFVKRIFKLDGDITVVGVDSDGNEIADPVFKIEEFISNRLDPLLNYVFFDDNSSALPAKYLRLKKSDIESFELSDLFRDSTLQIYHNILNILGDRLRKHPDAKLTLIGCNSDIDNEKNNLDLSMKRAETIKEYLVNNWGINTKRIKTEASNLPLKASTPKNEPDKIAENRRVEIYSDDYHILEPLFIEKVDRTANPPIVRFKLNGDSETGLKHWRISAKQTSNQENNFSFEFDGNLMPSVDWLLGFDQKYIPPKPEPLNYILQLEDKRGKIKDIGPKSIPIELVTHQKKQQELLGDYQIEKFSIILFDFDQSSLDANNKKIIEFIKGRISPDSEIEITGYTDRTGNPDYNLRLSKLRANAVKSAINRKDANVKGIGQSQLLYSNDSPEGRFYCRTVNILVRTKVK